jgi:hypothetical protein
MVNNGQDEQEGAEVKYKTLSGLEQRETEKARRIGCHSAAPRVRMHMWVIYLRVPEFRYLFFGVFLRYRIRIHIDTIFITIHASSAFIGMDFDSWKLLRLTLHPSRPSPLQLCPPSGKS